VTYFTTDRLQGADCPGDRKTPPIYASEPGVSSRKSGRVGSHAIGSEMRCAEAQAQARTTFWTAAPLLTGPGGHDRRMRTGSSWPSAVSANTIDNPTAPVMTGPVPGRGTVRRGRRRCLIAGDLLAGDRQASGDLSDAGLSARRAAARGLLARERQGSDDTLLPVSH
jgi:hypothetical protein